MSEDFDFDKALMEDDLFFDRHAPLMSPFDPNSDRHAGGGSGRGSRFYNELRMCSEEREVDFVYNKYLQKFFTEQMNHPYKCDGLINTETKDGKKLKVIFEFKNDMDFRKKRDIALFLVQVIYYLKKFEDNGQPLPNICFVGDVNECFVMHTDALNKYLDEPDDWNTAPSQVKNYNAGIVRKNAADPDINPFVFEINESFRTLIMSFLDVER